MTATCIKSHAWRWGRIFLVGVGILILWGLICEINSTIERQIRSTAARTAIDSVDALERYSARNKQFPQTQVEYLEALNSINLVNTYIVMNDPMVVAIAGKRANKNVIGGRYWSWVLLLTESRTNNTLNFTFISSSGKCFHTTGFEETRDLIFRIGP